MTRTALLDAVYELPDSKMITPAYYVDGDEWVDQFDAFCHDHAVIVAWWTALEGGFDTWVSAGWAETGRAERCAFGSCCRPLRSGGLTSCGIDDALALTEENPFASSVYPAELVLSADAMAPDDPRWHKWERQARRVLRSPRWRNR